MKQHKWIVIFNCQDTSTTIRIERDTGNPARQSLNLTCPGTDYRYIPGLSAEQAIAEANDLIRRGYATQYRIF